MLTTVLFVAALAIVVFFAARSSLKHLKGDSGCCGGEGVSFAVPTKELDGPIIGKKIVSIEGMHCENCKNSVERAVNRIEGASCTVDLKKNIAIVSYDRELDESSLRRAIEWIDFTVTGIEDKKVG